VTVSVVVPAFNEEAGLASALSSIRAAVSAFDRAGWTTELIVCDNNSTDRTADIARAAGATVVFEPINQISRARNRGAAQASGDWLVFVDADSHPSQALFEDVIREIRRGRALAGGSTVRFEAAHLSVHLAAWGWNAVSRLTRWAAGSFIFCDAAAFREAGGFSETLFAGEEIDLFRRLKRLARRNGRTIAILSRHPLLTSDRKARLYSSREMLTFALRTAMARGRTLRSAEGCHAWYDGRR
jgi:glycosyltransferase involved in cell wall biosynthesis